MPTRSLVSLLCLFGLVLTANLVFNPYLRAQGVQPYPDAITNRDFYAKTPMTPPAVNVPFVDPDLGGTMVRATGEGINPKDPQSYFHTPAPDANEWNMDESKFYVAGAHTTDFAFSFDPTTMTLGPLPGAGPGGGLVLPLRAGPTFSFVDADLMYGTEQKAPLTIATYRFSTGQVQAIYDTTNCGTEPALVAGPGVSSSDITLANDDSRIVISAGGKGVSDRVFAVVYDQTLGCRWYNTQTGEIGGQWGPTGQASTGDRFLFNHSKIYGDGRYVRISLGAGFYIWDTTSLTVTPCYIHDGPHCAGYGAAGYVSYINAPGVLDELNTFMRPVYDLGDLTQLIDPLPQPYYWGMEKAFAWNDGKVNENFPVCGSTYSPTGNEEVKQPYDGEIFCIETDGLGSTVWRFVHNRGTWEHTFYWTLPVISLSLDGHWAAFTSGWDDQVGTDWDGDPRTDVWIVKLQ
jgi:hypothetical protein